MKSIFFGIFSFSSLVSGFDLHVAYEAVVYGYPYVRMTQQLFTELNQVKEVNLIQKATNVLTPSTSDNTGAGTSPNSDTLYSYSWIDIRNGPMVFQVPQILDRFHVLQFMDFATNVIGSISPRNHDGSPLNIIISRNELDASLVPPNSKVFLSNTSLIWYLGRVLVQKVNDTQDLKEAVEIENQFKVISLAQLLDGNSTTVVSAAPLEGLPQITSVPQNSDQFFTVLDWALKTFGYPISDSLKVASFADVGVTLQGYQPERSNKFIRESAFKGAMMAIKNNFFGVERDNFWFTSNAIGNFGDDYLLRATVAMKYLGGNLKEDSLYFLQFFDSRYRFLNGKNSYKIEFTSPVPAKGFWSLTAYNNDHYFDTNSIGRYSIGTGTTGLIKNENGGFTLYLSLNPPADPKLINNWLPVPKDRFNVILRTYWPEPNMLDFSYKIPKLVRI